MEAKEPIIKIVQAPYKNSGVIILSRDFQVWHDDKEGGDSRGFVVQNGMVTHLVKENEKEDPESGLYDYACGYAADKHIPPGRPFEDAVEKLRKVAEEITIDNNAYTLIPIAPIALEKLVTINRELHRDPRLSLYRKPLSGFTVDESGDALLMAIEEIKARHQCDDDHLILNDEKNILTNALAALQERLSALGSTPSNHWANLVKPDKLDTAKDGPWPPIG